MPPLRCGYASCCAGTITLVLLCAGESAAQSVWSGLSFSFSKGNNVDVTLPENQDRITDSVWLTRDVLRGIFNINQESFYDSLSPADTEWATDLMLENAGETIAATNWADLTFTNWITAYGGTGSTQLPARLIGRDAVVHLITDDVYLDLQFTDWTAAGGGGFSYDRAVAPLPTTGDYNGDGVVDAADYVVWRKTLNEPAVPAGSGADGVPNGIIDADDYAFWRSRFGNDVPPGSGAGTIRTIPEPAAQMLLLTSLLSFACERKAVHFYDIARHK